MFFSGLILLTPAIRPADEMKKCLALLFVSFSVIAQAQTDSVKVDDADFLICP